VTEPIKDIPGGAVVGIEDPVANPITFVDLADA
jgi:hypothetical protein